MNDDKLIRLSAAVDLCRKKAKGYQPEMFGSDQECYTAKAVATELAGEIRNLPPVDAETHIKKLEAERDFLLKYLTDSHFVPCDICKHATATLSAMDCERVRKIKGPCFEWRGLPEG